MEENYSNLIFDNRPEPLTQGVLQAMQAGLELEMAWLSGDIGADPIIELTENIDANFRQIFNFPTDYRSILTSSRFESINSAIKGIAWGIEDDRNEIAIVRGDQGGFAEAATWCDRLGLKTTNLPLNTDGEPKLIEWNKLISDKTALIGISSVTPESHVKRNIRDIVSMCRKQSAISIVDYTEQCSGEIIDFDLQTPDMVSIDCTSFGGPIGVSALMISSQVRFSPMISGDLLQNGLRSGRISIQLLSGLLASIDELKDRVSRRENVNDGLQSVAVREIKHKLPDIKIPSPLNILKTGILFFVPEIEGEALVLSLEKKNIYVTTGSSCSGTAGKPSQTLMEMGYSERDASGAIHLAFREDHTKENIVQAVSTIAKTIGELWRTAGYSS